LSKKTGACPEDGAYPILPCTVSHLHATVSHSRRLSCIACHSFQCSNDFFSYTLLQCSTTFSVEFRFPCYPAELFLSCACYGLTYSFVHYGSVRELICSLFWPKKLESSAEKEKKNSFQTSILSREREFLTLL